MHYRRSPVEGLDVLYSDLNRGSAPLVVRHFNGVGPHTDVSVCDYMHKNTIVFINRPACKRM